VEILITWHGDQFNVELSSKPGKEPFVTIKGARIVDGSKGTFISWPATKNQNTGKFWQHVWCSEEFNAVVLSKAQAGMPSKAPARAPARSAQGDDDRDVPF
jgi:hypothetical protein